MSSLRSRTEDTMGGSLTGGYSSILYFRVGPDPNPSKLPSHWNYVSKNYPPGENEFVLHRDLVGTFCKRIGVEIERARLENRRVGDTIVLPDVDRRIFFVFAKWLYSGMIKLSWRVIPERLLLIDAYALGCRLEASAFRNKVCEIVATAIASDKDLPSYDDIMRAYDEEKAPYEKLRDIFVDAYLAYSKMGDLNDLFLHDIYPRAFLKRIMSKEGNMFANRIAVRRPKDQMDLYYDTPTPIKPTFHNRKGPKVVNTSFGKVVNVGVFGSATARYIHREIFDRNSRYFTEWERGCMFQKGFELGRQIVVDWLYVGKVDLYKTPTIRPLIQAYIVAETLGITEACDDICDAITWYTTIYFYDITRVEIIWAYDFSLVDSPLRRLLVAWWIRNVAAHPDLAAMFPSPKITYRDPSFRPVFAADIEKERSERTRLALDDIKWTTLPPGRAHGTVHPRITEDMLADRNQEAQWEFSDEQVRNVTPYFGDRLCRFHHHAPSRECRSLFPIKAFRGEDSKEILKRVRQLAQTQATDPTAREEMKKELRKLFPAGAQESEVNRVARLKRLPAGWRSRVTSDGRRYFVDGGEQLWFVDPRGVKG